MRFLINAYCSYYSRENVTNSGIADDIIEMHKQTK